MPVTRNAHTDLSMGPVTVMTPILPMGPAIDHPASIAADTEAGEGEGEGDDRTYCFCDGVSYGEMIACDDEDCEREWVRSFTFVPYRTTSDCGPCPSSSTLIASVSRRSLMAHGSARCVEQSKRMPSAPRGVEKSASVARVRAGRPPITLDIIALVYLPYV